MSITNPSDLSAVNKSLSVSECLISSYSSLKVFLYCQVLGEYIKYNMVAFLYHFLVGCSNP